MLFQLFGVEELCEAPATEMAQTTITDHKTNKSVMLTIPNSKFSIEGRYPSNLRNMVKLLLDFAKLFIKNNHYAKYFLILSTHIK